MIILVVETTVSAGFWRTLTKDGIQAVVSEWLNSTLMVNVCKSPIARPRLFYFCETAPVKRLKEQNGLWGHSALRVSRDFRGISSAGAVIPRFSWHACIPAYTGSADHGELKHLTDVPWPGYDCTQGYRFITVLQRGSICGALPRTPASPESCKEIFYSFISTGVRMISSPGINSRPKYFRIFSPYRNLNIS